MPSVFVVPLLSSVLLAQTPATNPPPPSGAPKEAVVEDGTGPAATTFAGPPPATGGTSTTLPALGSSTGTAAPDVPTPAAVTAEPSSASKLVAVLDLKVEGDVQALANALATVIATDISSRPGLRAVSRNELKSLLSHNADASLLGCDSANCASDVAKLVDAQFVLAGTLGLVPVADANGTRPLLLTLTLIEPSTSAVVSRADVSWRGAAEELVTAVRPTLDRVFDGAAASAYLGHLELFAPDGSTLMVDGKEVGKAPLSAAVRNLPIGVHTVEVTGSGYVPARVDVVVSRNETSVVRVILEEAPYYTQWWFWTAVGAGAAAAVTAGTLIGLQFLDEPPTRVVVKAPLPSFSAVSP